MEFKLISLKQRNIIARIFNIYNYKAVVEKNNKQYKLNVHVRKDADLASILRSISYALDNKIAQDTFDLTLEDLNNCIGKDITKEYFR